MSDDWLASVILYPAPNLWPAVMLSTLIVSFALALLLRGKTWTGTGLLAAFVVFVTFSVMLTVANGVHSTDSLGSIFLWFNVSIVAFPTTGVVRLVMTAVRLVRAAPARQD